VWRTIVIYVLVKTIPPEGAKWFRRLCLLKISTARPNGKTQEPRLKRDSTDLQGVRAMLALYFSIADTFSGASCGKNCDDGVMKRDGARQRGHFLVTPE
jgi:hypothetical protein